MILDSLNLPYGIQSLDLKELELLAEEVRTRIIEVVKANGGHLAASLGAVDITVAMLHEFSPLKDIILYDVGHQAYSYKLLTDRRDTFAT
ncbi:MAG: 1-deoxy-D-xylulose-5-phosphate synthase, partial [Clostridia bacterium]|nr:1-deoxy-D-xylulose-5-phosphate synthase [Clostridia bacterium]